jgi:hypothetical protein
MLVTLSLVAAQCNIKPNIDASGGVPVTILTFAVISGIFFGLCCHFFVLIPVTLLGALTSTLGASFDGQSAASAFFAVIVPSVALQGGYLIGLTARDLIGPAAYMRGSARRRSESKSRS